MNIKLFYNLTYVGTFLLLYGHYNVVMGDPTLGFGLRTSSMFFLSPYAIATKQWYLVLIEVVFFILDISKFIQLLTT